MKLSDLHIHSDNSFDAKNSVDELCKTAVNRDLYAIAITDHCEAQFAGTGCHCEFGDFDKRIAKSYCDSMEAKQKYSDSLKVLCGMELAQPCHDKARTEHALSYGDFDFILASVHNVRGREDFFYIDFSKENIENLLNEYFDELAETASFPYFDSLAHLTYPFRYIKSPSGTIMSAQNYQNKIDEIYKILIQNNKALEINVSGLAKGLGAALPDEYQIKRFYELGGKYVTIGSDAHETDFVGKFIKQGAEIAKNAGFKHYTIFEKHNPILIEIM